jgi:hypothetical protein
MNVVWLSTVAIGAIAIYLWTTYGREGVSLRTVAVLAFRNPLYTATLVALATVVARSLLFRLGDKDRR